MGAIKSYESALGSGPSDAVIASLRSEAIRWRSNSPLDCLSTLAMTQMPFRIDGHTGATRVPPFSERRQRFKPQAGDCGVEGKKKPLPQGGNGNG
jgi:hypothetical protein